MPKSRLQEPYRTLEGDLIKGMAVGLHVWRPDLDFPASYSDMQACVREILRHYKLTRIIPPIDLPEEDA